MPDIKQDFCLKPLNRMRTGGNAQYYAEVFSLDELQEKIHFAQKAKIPFYVLGSGSNVVIDDNDFKGLVLSLKGEWQTIDFGEQSVSAGAGASLVKLGKQLVEKGGRDYAYLTVIPGTVGGAVRINAGHSEQEQIKNIFLKARVYDPATGSAREYTLDDMGFGYRSSALVRSRKVLLQVTFKLPRPFRKASRGTPECIRDKLHDMNRSVHLQGQRTCGSVFRNPKHGDHAAGWYLEQVGMKGLQIGGARVSDEHANWIINTGNATSDDIKDLVATGQKRVFEKFGVQLEREVIFLPGDMEGWT